MICIILKIYPSSLGGWLPFQMGLLAAPTSHFFPATFSLKCKIFPQCPCSDFVRKQILSAQDRRIKMFRVAKSGPAVVGFSP